MADSCEVRKVAIVGAGVSGLVAIKSCLEEGLIPVCFEKRNGLGGRWRFEDENGTTSKESWFMDTLVTNSSREMLCYSDFPFPESTPCYIPGRDVLKYYEGYADHFNLKGHIRFKTTTLKIEKKEDFKRTGQWLVTTQFKGAVYKEMFDAVMLCTGQYNEPIIPTYRGQENFVGKILHSETFRTSDVVEGKQVLVVGGSHSAGDVAVHARKVAKQVYLSTRDGTWLVRRCGPRGVPHDTVFQRLFMSWLPRWFTQVLANVFFFSNINHQELGLQSSRRYLNAPPMVNDVMQVEIMCGKILPRPGIDHFTSKGVVFKDGTSVDVDVVIFATGYKRKNQYIDSAIIQEDMHSQELYKYVFPPRLEHPTCACIGATALFGPHGPCFEMQTRWAVKVFKGQCTLPPIDEMMDEIRGTRENNRERFGKDKIFVSICKYVL
ncbi:Dimethylaniline monooxygenase [N-oxide-forming] 2 [Holothuria leucospilota]|uniref:Flavin-containing monooxygenase n=1 Tax=Holothuria leucospilota TaxID=206669 RepID=A0A9Q1B9Y6_HOLLE|nr:Dimethylaniline monooxygenase [N-oxide-forming] 2 [Holothuria leucospilota]